jgi:hypothetical protein
MVLWQATLSPAVGGRAAWLAAVLRDGPMTPTAFQRRSTCPAAASRGQVERQQIHQGEGRPTRDALQRPEWLASWARPGACQLVRGVDHQSARPERRKESYERNPRVNSLSCNLTELADYPPARESRGRRVQNTDPSPLVHFMTSGQAA